MFLIFDRYLLLCCYVDYNFAFGHFAAAIVLLFHFMTFVLYLFAIFCFVFLPRILWMWIGSSLSSELRQLGSLVDLLMFQKFFRATFVLINSYDYIIFIAFLVELLWLYFESCVEASRSEVLKAIVLIAFDENNRLLLDSAYGIVVIGCLSHYHTIHKPFSQPLGLETYVFFWLRQQLNLSAYCLFGESIIYLNVTCHR